MTDAATDEAIHAEPLRKKPGRKPSGTGMHLDKDGYLVIHRGEWRNRYAHRAYLARQWKETYGTELPDSVEVHHSCGNRSCWPPTDAHLIVMDEALHHADAARNGKRHRKHGRKHTWKRRGTGNRNKETRE
jgi:hypothetical protein